MVSHCRLDDTQEYRFIASHLCCVQKSYLWARISGSNRVTDIKTCGTCTSVLYGTFLSSLMGVYKATSILFLVNVIYSKFCLDNIPLCKKCQISWRPKQTPWREVRVCSSPQYSSNAFDFSCKRMRSNAFASIWRIRSRVTPNFLPTSSSV